MTTTLLTGATGRLGEVLLPRLREAGHDVRPASRSPPTDDEGWCELDLAAGIGVRRAVEDAEVVVHAASAPTGDTEAVDVRGTERLLEAAAEADVQHVLYVSIVGIDDIPFSYYERKLAAERAVEERPVPSSILRATQFHQFVRDLLDGVARLPVWPLPTTFRIQPVDAVEVAAAVVEHATSDPAGRLPAVGGPEVQTVGDLARAYRDARGLRRPVVRLPLPGGTASAFRDGEATRPDRAVGSVTWGEYLDREFGVMASEGEAGNPGATG